MRQIGWLGIGLLSTWLAAGCSSSNDSLRRGSQAGAAKEMPPAATVETTSTKNQSMEAEQAGAARPTSAEKDSSEQIADGATADARAPRSDSEPVSVTFEDLNLNMQADIVYRPVMMTDRVRELEGQRIKLKGFMLPDARTRKIKEFVLVKNTECKFGPGGQADHLAEIKLQGEATATHTNRPVEVEGVLRIEPFQGTDGNTWSIFQIEATSVRPG